jgi:hypothetical protein
MRVLSVAAVALTLPGCNWLDPHRDEHIAEETLQACRGQLSERWNNLSAQQRDHYINGCLTWAGFRVVGCDEKGAFKENGVCWLRRQIPPTAAKKVASIERADGRCRPDRRVFDDSLRQIPFRVAELVVIERGVSSGRPGRLVDESVRRIDDHQSLDPGDSTHRPRAHPIHERHIDRISGDGAARHAAAV